MRAVAVANRASRGLPRSARSLRGVPSLIPRESATGVIETARRVLPSPNHEGLGLSIVFTRLRLGLLRATARRFAAGGLLAADILAPLLLVASRRHAGDLATRMLDSFEGGLLSSR